MWDLTKRARGSLSPRSLYGKAVARARRAFMQMWDMANSKRLKKNTKGKLSLSSLTLKSPQKNADTSAPLLALMAQSQDPGSRIV